MAMEVSLCIVMSHNANETGARAHVSDVVRNHSHLSTVFPMSQVPLTAVSVPVLEPETLEAAV